MISRFSSPGLVSRILERRRRYRLSLLWHRRLSMLKVLCTQVDDILGNEQKERIVSKLHEIFRPFLHRRMKKDVLLKMPPKLEIVVYCGMSSMQREYYARVQDNSIRDALLNMGIIENAGDISQINQLMNLRKVCAVQSGQIHS
jgi:SNF2 family DNA or RNA helicase